jgi:hypothetical protein
MPRARISTLSAVLGFCVLSAAPSSPGSPAEGDIVTVVASKVDASYVRSRLPNGSFKPEYYSFADGGHWSGTVRDASLDDLAFMDIARTIVPPLQSQNYLPTKDASAANLLIMVYWGRTRTPEHANDSVAAANLQGAAANRADAKSLSEHQFYNNSNGLAPIGTIPCVKYTAAPSTDLTQADNAMAGALATSAAENRSRDQADALNASLLGYDSWWDATAGFKGTPLEHRREDMLNELEHDRYFVVLMAYDFQMMWKQKKHKLLWETRFSVQQRGVEFDKRLSAMAMDASRYFGQDSHGLVHRDLPLGHVDIGDLKSLGPVAAAK